MQPKFKRILIVLLTMLTLIGTMTAIMTLANTPSAEPFLHIWFRSFIFAFLVLVPMGITLFSVLNKLIVHFFPTCSHLQKSLLLGVLMPVLMESIMAIITILNSHSYESIEQFSSSLFKTLLYALPIGLIFSCYMTLVIKPKLEKYLTNVPV